MKPIKLNIQRKAIAMIELIFAIVIMGIVLLSIPNLISVSTSSGYISLQQEAIATVSSQINLVLTKHWDENNVIDSATGITSTAILRTDGVASLNTRSGARTRTFILSGGAGDANASVLGPDVNDFDDIDDAHGTTMTLRNFADTSVSAGDIIDTNITIATTVNYIADATSTTLDYNTSNTIQFNFSTTPLVGATSNIKAITTQLTTNNSVSELAKDIKLQAFSTNIGSYVPERRSL